MATAISNIATSNTAAVSNINQLHSASVAKAASSSVGAAGIVKDDTVKITVAANIKLMHHEGLSASIIASRIGMSVKQVNTYLPGSTQTTSPAAPVTPTSSGGSAPAAKGAPASSNETAETATATPASLSEQAPTAVKVTASATSVK